MSAIDWSAKKEPWRSMGLGFVIFLQTGARQPAYKKRRNPIWPAARIRALLYAREVEKKRWKAIAVELGTTEAACHSVYKKHYAFGENGC